MTDQPTPSTLTDADLLAWAVVLGYREQQQRDGITLLLLPLPPCPTCKSTVFDGTASWVREASLEELTINMRPCGHAHRASLLDLEAMQDHVAGMLFTLTEADNGRQDVGSWLPAGRRWTTDDIIREAHARVGQSQQAESDQPRGPVDWARRQAAEREQQAAMDPRQPAYDAVYAYIRELGDYLPPDPVHRNVLIWRGVHAALDAVTGTRDRELERMKVLVAASESDGHAMRMAAQYADRAIENGERADRAEAAIVRARQLHRESCPVAQRAVHPTAFTCGMCDALADPQETP